MMDRANGANVTQSSSVMQRKAIIAKLKASGIAKRKIEENNTSDDEQEYNFEKLKTFHIPRKKEQQEGKDIMTDLPLNSREYTHALYPNVKTSFLYPHSSRKIKITKAELINNAQLQKEFLEKKKDMKDSGRLDKELSESLAYLHFTNRDEVTNICENGLSVDNCNLVSLGKPSMGVYLCKHADIVSPAPIKPRDVGFIIVFKITKGKTKLVTECRSATTTQEPTPLYDCHITKLNTEGSKGNHARAYQALQYYLYEYGELDLVSRPRHILPHAVLHYTCVDYDKTVQHRDSLSTPMETSAAESDGSKSSFPSTSDLQTFCLWKGKLLVKGGLFCNVQMTTNVDTAVNKAFLDKNINVKSIVSVEKFSRLIPPTLLGKSGKKHNILYRSRNYNIFMLTPSDESGFGKFRQLIAHLVQENAIAVVPLRMASCMYLMAKSHLTIQRMGLTAPYEDHKKPNTHYLHVLVVTPKNLSSKVNDLKVYNLITVRKRRESLDDTKLPDELDMKLRAMNIESVSAVGSMPPEQLDKLSTALKDKRRFQTGDKLLLNYYKDNENLLPTKHGHNKFAGKVGALWSSTCQVRMDYYKPEETSGQAAHGGKKSILKGSNLPKSKQASHNLENPLPDATFSDEDGSEDSDTVKRAGSGAKSVDKASKATEKRKLSLEVDTKNSVPPVKVSRPSFKGIEEMLFSNDISELMRHPDFVFSERFEKTHRVSKGPSFAEELDLERENQIKVVFRQQVPFSTEKDCPYAHEGHPIVKSMLRAIYGMWDQGASVPAQDKDKVDWVRNVLHRKKNQTSDPRQAVITADEDRLNPGAGTSSDPKDSSPLARGSSSTDSGFASSSTTTTPNAGLQQAQSSSIHDLASLLACALQDKPSGDDTTLTENRPDTTVQPTTQDILQVLAKTVNESGLDLPNDLKDIIGDISSKERLDEKEVIDSEIVPSNPAVPPHPTVPPDPKDEPNQVPVSSHQSPLPAVQGVSDRAAQERGNPPKHTPFHNHPQDPRLNRSGSSHHHLNLPNYHFPPPEEAIRLLPKDEEAAQYPLPLDHLKALKSKETLPSNVKGNGFRTTTQRAKTGNMNQEIIRTPQEQNIPVIMTRQSYLDPKKMTVDSVVSRKGRILRKIPTTSDLATGSNATLINPIQDANRNIGKGTTTDPGMSTTLSYLTMNPPAPSIQATEFQKTDTGKKIGGHITINDLTCILRQAGVIPDNPKSQDPKARAPNHPGMMEGAGGPNVGPTEKTEDSPFGSSGEALHSIGDKRVLLSPNKINIRTGPLGAVPSRGVLSDKMSINASREKINFDEHLPCERVENLKIKITTSDSSASIINAARSLVHFRKAQLTDSVVSSLETSVNTVSSGNDSVMACNVVSSSASTTNLLSTVSKTQEISSLSSLRNINTNAFSQSSMPPVVSSLQSAPKPPTDSAAFPEAAKTVVPVSSRSTVSSEPPLQLSEDDIKRICAKRNRTKKKQKLKTSLLNDESGLNHADEVETLAVSDKTIDNLPLNLDIPVSGAEVKFRATSDSGSATIGTVSDPPRLASADNTSLPSSSTNAIQTMMTTNKNLTLPTAVVSPAQVIFDSVSVAETSTAPMHEPNPTFQQNSNPASAPSDSIVPSDDIYSEIDSLLSRVRDAQQGHTSANVLSSRLLELALQLRTDSQLPAFQANQPVENPASHTITTATSNPIDLVDEKMMMSFPSQTHGLDSCSSSLNRDSPITSDRPRRSDDISIHRTSLPLPNCDTIQKANECDENFYDVPQSISSPTTLNSKPTEPTAVGSLKDESTALLQNVAKHDVLRNEMLADGDRDANTPTQDERSNIDDAVTASLCSSYKMLKPLSNLILSEVSLGEKVSAVLQRVDEGTSDASEESKNIESSSVSPCNDDTKALQSSSSSASPSAHLLLPTEPKSLVTEPSIPEAKGPFDHVSSSIEQSPLASDQNFISRPQRIALVKPQPMTPRVPSFFVFNPRGHTDCDEIESLLLMTNGIPFQIDRIEDVIAYLTKAEDDGRSTTSIQVNKEMLDRSLNARDVWIVIRSVDLDLMAALPYLSLFKCARRKVQFVQADSAEDVNAHRYTNILSGEYGIFVPVSVDVILQNSVVFLRLMRWMSRIRVHTGHLVWRIALYKHIVRHLQSLCTQSGGDEIKKNCAIRVLGALAKHSGVIIKISARNADTTDVTASEVFDNAIALQLRNLLTTRHIVVLTEEDHTLSKWRTHRRAGIAVATLQQFVREVVEESSGGGNTSPYSPLMKLYRVER